MRKKVRDAVVAPQHAIPDLVHLQKVDPIFPLSSPRIILNEEWMTTNLMMNPLARKGFVEVVAIVAAQRIDKRIRQFVVQNLGELMVSRVRSIGF